MRTRREKESMGGDNYNTHRHAHTRTHASERAREPPISSPFSLDDAKPMTTMQPSVGGRENTSHGVRGKRVRVEVAPTEDAADHLLCGLVPARLVVFDRQDRAALHTLLPTEDVREGRGEENGEEGRQKKKRGGRQDDDDTKG